MEDASGPNQSWRGSGILPDGAAVILLLRVVNPSLGALSILSLFSRRGQLDLPSATRLPSRLFPRGLYRRRRDPADVDAFPTGVHDCATTTETATVVFHGERSVAGLQHGCIEAPGMRVCVTTTAMAYGRSPRGTIRGVDPNG